MSAAPALTRPLARDPGMAPLVAGERVILRPLRLADADAIGLSLADAQVARMLAHVPVPYFRQDALDWLVCATSGMLPGWLFAVTMADDVLIGVVSIVPRDGAWTIEYWVNRFYWRKGFGRMAVSAALDRFFQRMPDARVLSRVPADDAPALKLQAGLGFTVSGCDERFLEARGRMVMMIESRIDAASLRRA
ncbi:hypothetical protein BJF93_15440 [Xaviernesmea oryzae]|uniref:N-acetyltransferase domain-containing protein n=1 Tax=Xaviernesmea oryzae TaxID=464029 RepID=A0A1Q9AY20_9HYPH|nr:GNAT family N-acetyltransferase [Xaviernesmea oryzae]OLP60348.1 hypothetical protein BJF93_15440 [Xaviernesmea oryzae]SEK22261.1 Protein N-acetyltransferase, RimJ/RimL family [Xaviernesmea oryzae]